MPCSKLVLLVISTIMISSCSSTAPVLSYRISGNSKFLEEACRIKNNANACLEYGVHLRDSGDPKNQRINFYKKACTFDNNEGCALTLLYLKQQVGFDYIRNKCLQKDKMECTLGGYALFENGHLNKSLEIFQLGCKYSLDDTNCKMKAEVSQRIKERDRKEREENLAQQKHDEMIFKANKCANSNATALCIESANYFHFNGDLDKAIKVSGFACAQGSNIGCKLQANYITQKNGMELVEQQAISNANQVIAIKQQRQIEQQRMNMQLYESLIEGLRTPANIQQSQIVQPQSPTRIELAPRKCRSTFKRNPYLNQVEGETSCD